MLSQVGRLPSLRLHHCVKLRPANVDDIASIRYVHETAFQCYSAEYHTPQETAAFLDMLRDVSYGLSILRSNVFVAMIGEEIVGTAGWLAADDRGAAARLKQVFVRPLFGGAGIGRLLVNDAEKRAARAGFFDFSVRVSVASIAFYKKLGYRVSSHGVFTMPNGVELPVTYMRKATARRHNVEYH